MQPTHRRTALPMFTVGVKPAPSVCAHAGDSTIVAASTDDGYDLVLLPIVLNRYRDVCQGVFREWNALLLGPIEVPPPSLLEVYLMAGPHLQRTIGLVSLWIELELGDRHIAEFLRQVLAHEVGYASYLGLTRVIVAPPKDVDQLACYSRALLGVLRKHPEMSVSVLLPFCEELPEDPRQSHRQSTASSTSWHANHDYLLTWEMWHALRIQCNYHPQLAVLLALPRSPIPLYVADRWFAEPIGAILVLTLVFVANMKAYPVLSKYNQQIVHRFLDQQPVLLLHGTEKELGFEGGSAAFGNYLHHICVLKRKGGTDRHQQSVDVLQPPLEPASAILQQAVYATFEKDRPKYAQYEKAIRRAVADLALSVGLSGLCICVVGAGQGPLVQQVLEALADRKITRFRLYAIERNPGAVVRLQQRNRSEWDNAVQVVQGDIRVLARQWALNMSDPHVLRPPPRFDLVVLELLGLFGCNELLPECLAAVTPWMSTAGVVIPRAYYSYIAPAFLPKMHQQVRARREDARWHTPYVVNLQSACLLLTRIHQGWLFEHTPAPDTAFSRRCNLTFKVLHKASVHGLVGYFVAVLYPGITLSTNPQFDVQDLPASLRGDSTDSGVTDGMRLWYPMWFPLEQPLYLTDETELDVSMWREVEQGEAWYEWGAEAFVYVVDGEGEGEGDGEQVRVRTGVTSVHNLGGGVRW